MEDNAIAKATDGTNNSDGASAFQNEDSNKDTTPSKGRKRGRQMEKLKSPVSDCDPVVDYFASPEKKAKESPLHKLNMVPFKFLEDAVNRPVRFLGLVEEPEQQVLSKNCKVGECFGLNEEAYFRQCHEELMDEVHTEVENWIDQDQHRMRLAELRGSSGVGKSAFLAYVIAYLRHHGELESFAIIHAGKSQSGQGQHGMGSAICSVWINDELKVDQVQRARRKKIAKSQQNKPLLNRFFRNNDLSFAKLHEGILATIVR